MTRARPGRKQRPVAAAPGGRPASPGYGLILDLEVVGSDICSKQPLCTWRPESRQESSLRPGDLSLGSVDINFRDRIRSSVEVRSEVLLYPGHPCHLPFSDIRKKFEEKDENKRKQKKKKCSLDTVKLQKLERAFSLDLRTQVNVSEGSINSGCV